MRRRKQWHAPIDRTSGWRRARSRSECHPPIPCAGGSKGMTHAPIDRTHLSFPCAGSRGGNPYAWAKKSSRIRTKQGEKERDGAQREREEKPRSDPGRKSRTPTSLRENTVLPPPPPAVPPQSARAVPRGTIQSQPSDEGRSTVQIWYRPLSRTVKTLISHSKYLRIDNRPGPLFVFLIFLHTPYAVERVANVRIPVRSRYL